MNYFTKQWPSLGLLIGLLTFPIYSSATALLLNAESAAALGEVFSGAAASADDASTNYYNPAGLVKIPCPQIVGSAEGILLKNRFTGTTEASYDIFGSEQIQTGTVRTIIKGLVPGFYFSTPFVKDYVWLGFGITSPSGLTITYPNSSFVRYNYTKIKFQTANLNVNMAVRITKQFSAGYGVNVMRSTTLSKINVLNPLNDEPEFDWNLDLRGTAYSYGANVGVLYEPCETTRIGLSYRSSMKIETVGRAILNTHGDFQGTTEEPLYTNNFKVNTSLPATAYLSFYQRVTPCLEAMASAYFEQWSSLKNIRLTNVPVPTVKPIQINIAENFDNTISYSIGARYQINKQWKIKSGIGYSPSAVTSANRNFITPVTQVWTIALGTHYQYSRQLGFDLSAAHFFFKPGPINNSLSNTVDTVFFPVTYTTKTTGTSRFYGDILGAQMTYDLI